MGGGRPKEGEVRPFPEHIYNKSRPFPVSKRGRVRDQHALKIRKKELAEETYEPAGKKPKTSAARKKTSKMTAQLGGGKGGGGGGAVGGGGARA